MGLAKEYPNVGQQGLQHEVERLGFDVDPHELKLFLRDHGHLPDFTPRVERRPGQWDTGWPNWANMNPSSPMDWPEEEPFEYRFPYWGWMSKQPLWYRLLLASIVFVIPAFVAVVIILDRLGFGP